MRHKETVTFLGFMLASGEKNSGFCESLWARKKYRRWEGTERRKRPCSESLQNPSVLSESRNQRSATKLRQEPGLQQFRVSDPGMPHYMYEVSVEPDGM